MKKIGLMETKQALRDPKFRDSLPLELRDDVVKYLENPGCACNVPIYRRILKDFSKYILAYYPGAEIIDEAEEALKLAQNHWQVINCHISELEKHLRALSPGRKQIDVSRFQDQVTVVINELEQLW